MESYRRFLCLLICCGSLAELRQDESDVPALWDFVVVGAGTGGSVCAGRLAATGAKVLLIEAGSWEPDWLYNQTLADGRTDRGIDWDYPTRFPRQLTVQNTIGRKKRIAAGRVVGGSSAVHGDVYDKPPLNEFQVQGLSSWTAERVAAAFERIEASMTMEYIGFKSPHHIPHAHDYMLQMLQEKMPLEFLPEGPPSHGSKAGVASGWKEFRSCAPVSETCRAEKGCNVRADCLRSTSYRDLVASQNASGDLTVLADALVSKVIIEDGQANGVQLLRNGSRFPMEAFARHAVVLAAGALGTPKILMLSGVGDPFELQRLAVPVQVANREVGQNLADHLAHFTWFVMKSGEEIERDDPGCLSHELYNAFFNITGPQDSDGPIEAEVRFYGGCNFDRNSYDFGIEAVLLHPKSRGRVALTSSKPEALPIAEFPELWDEDYKGLEALLERIAHTVGLAGNDLVSSVGYTLHEDVREKAYLYQHLCCSARAAPEGAPGVLDEDLSVRGVRGLFVADASALPALPSGHTSAAALLVGELAAESARAAPERPLPDRAARSSMALLLGSLAPSEQVMSQVPTVPVRGLENKESVAMPVVALGTGTMAKQKVASSVAAFLSLGGRHLDTAAMYENYVQVREGIESSGLRDLSDLVITGKVMPLGREHVLAGIQEALAGLNVRSIDIMLLQWPGDNPAGKLLRGAPLPSCADRFERAGVVSVSWRRCRVESYKALVEEQAAGRVRAIGVSNFARRHLIDLDQEGLTKPAVHQLEFHPIWHEDTLLDISRAHGTEVQAYGCLGGAHTGAMLLRTEPILKTAARLNVTPAQVRSMPSTPPKRQALASPYSPPSPVRSPFGADGSFTAATRAATMIVEARRTRASPSLSPSPAPMSPQQDRSSSSSRGTDPAAQAAWRAEVQRRALEEMRRYRQSLRNCEGGLSIRPCTEF